MDCFTFSDISSASSSVNLDLAMMVLNRSSSCSIFSFCNVSSRVISDQLTHDNLFSNALNSFVIFNVTDTIYISPFFLISSNLSNASALFRNRFFNTSGQLISGCSSIFFFNSLGMETVSVGMLTSPISRDYAYLQHLVNKQYTVFPYKLFDGNGFIPKSPFSLIL